MLLITPTLIVLAAADDDAAVDAAADVPGEGTTPIKFYGDRSYTGKAWT